MNQQFKFKQLHHPKVCMKTNIRQLSLTNWKFFKTVRKQFKYYIWFRKIDFTEELSDLMVKRKNSF